MNNTNNYIDLPHRYLLETDIEAVFDSYKDDLPVVLGYYKTTMKSRATLWITVPLWAAKGAATMQTVVLLKDA